MKRHPEEERVKVTFEIERSWHGSSTESVWAKPLNSNFFVLLNSPLFAFGVNYLDEVAVRKEGRNGLLFEHVEKRSGHSTYRLMITSPTSVWQSYWMKLEQIGCSYEEGFFGENHLLAVDVPSDVSIYAAYELMEKGAEDGAWDFEEAAVGHPLD